MYVFECGFERGNYYDKKCGCLTINRDAPDAEIINEVFKHLSHIQKDGWKYMMVRFPSGDRIVNREDIVE